MVDVLVVDVGRDEAGDHRHHGDGEHHAAQAADTEPQADLIQRGLLHRSQRTVGTHNTHQLLMISPIKKNVGKLRRRYTCVWTLGCPNNTLEKQNHEIF